MSYLVTSSYLEEVDIVAGFFPNGAPKHLIPRSAGAVFTPQGGNAAQVARWQSAGLVVPSASLPTVTTLTPTHATAHAKIGMNGTGLDQVAAQGYVGFKLTAGGPEVRADSIRSVSPTQLVIVVPWLQPGAYTVTAYHVGGYVVGSAALVIDGTPS